ncbi:hypothetical protein [Rathayibacter sp. VKM Ac-2630]|uniref:hypothetical protein n=1 Tax=Rathayibacter sp. VKM Ac-2630 TaxID=1938617 RepID=UPI000981E3F3|nr:hypothetical protein [Rathayibacter sp. VKM Ac-2630]OOB90719.1 hypothetical protein B0T42_09940 [Rathayibacter sp. VKM Ac-2630]
MTEQRIKTPDDVIDDVEAALERIEAAPETVAAAETRRDEAVHALAMARARLKLTVDGSTAERREARIVLETAELAQAVAVAKVAVTYAKGQADAADKRLSGAQTIARMVERTLDSGRYRP